MIMNKILINIYIPASEKNIEVRVPKTMKIGELTEMVKGYLLKDETINFIPAKDTRLCDERKGNIYPYSASMYELDLSEGQRMTLM